jgi:predicted Zn-dependent protease
MKNLIPLVLLAAVIAACGHDDESIAQAGEIPASDPVTPAVVTTPRTDPTPVIVGPVSFEDAETSFREKRYDEAIAMFTAYTDSKPENPWGFYMLGLSAWKSGDHKIAEENLRRTMELDSSHVKSRYNLSRVLMETNRHADAEQIIQQAIALAPTSSEGYRLLARAYDGVGRGADALWASKRAIVLDGRDVWALNNLGAMLIRQEKFEEALGPLARAVELAPEVPTFQNNFGVALERTGFFLASAEAYRAALAVDSTYEKSAVGLARVEQLSEDASRTPFDQLVVVEQFLNEVEGWRQEVAERQALN